MSQPRWFVDFQASGIAPDSYLIKTAVVSADSHHHALIKPASYWTHCSYDAQDMHQMPREGLVDRGADPQTLSNRVPPNC
jgi:hypothetical protein